MKSFITLGPGQTAPSGFMSQSDIHHSTPTQLAFDKTLQCAGLLLRTFRVNIIRMVNVLKCLPKKDITRSEAV